MVLCILVRRKVYSKKRLARIKYNLDSFKEGVILLYQSILETNVKFI